MKDYYACKECGQVYIDHKPEECFRPKCDSKEFESIGVEDVLDMHDFFPFLIETFKKKLSELFRW